MTIEGKAFTDEMVFSEANSNLLLPCARDLLFDTRNLKP
jgi:hypothetical protein